jgi:hypothetical protein
MSEQETFNRHPAFLPTQQQHCHRRLHSPSMLRKLSSKTDFNSFMSFTIEWGERKKVARIQMSDEKVSFEWLPHPQQRSRLSSHYQETFLFRQHSQPLKSLIK